MTDVTQGGPSRCGIGSAGRGRTSATSVAEVETLLNDPEWVKWSNVQIGEQCGVSEGLVRRLRPIFVQNEDTPRLASVKVTLYSQSDEKALSLNGLEIDRGPRIAIRNGTMYELNPANIGRFRRLG